MTLVLDASVVVAAVTDAGAVGDWARDTLGHGHLVAPHLLPVEVTNTLRRLLLVDRIDGSAASAGLRDLSDLGIELYGFEPFADRVWELRSTVTAYDAWCVALAEALGVPLVTLDRRLARAKGPRSAFLQPL